jgi:hypothetical protein
MKKKFFPPYTNKVPKNFEKKNFSKNLRGYTPQKEGGLKLKNPHKECGGKKFFNLNLIKRSLNIRQYLNNDTLIAMRNF